MLNEFDLVEKLQKIEALYLGATTAGEKAAAAQAMSSIQNKINSTREQERQERHNQAVEWTFRVNNYFEKRLLNAVLNKHGLKSYRYSGQRYTTLMVKTNKHFVDTVIWPQYTQMSKVLTSYLDQVTNEVIMKAMGQKEAEDDVRPEPLQLQ